MRPTSGWSAVTSGTDSSSTSVACPEDHPLYRDRCVRDRAPVRHVAGGSPACRLNARLNAASDSPSERDAQVTDREFLLRDDLRTGLVEQRRAEPRLEAAPREDDTCCGRAIHVQGDAENRCAGRSRTSPSVTTCFF